MASVSAVIFDIIAKDGASAAFRRVGDSASMAADRAMKMGKSMTLGVTLPMAAVGVAAVKSATDFNSAMTRIQTQAGGSAKDVKTLSAQVLALGGKVQQTPVELANALYHLKSVGLDNVQAMHALVQSSHLAAVGNANLEETTNAVAGAWRTGIKGATNFKDSVRTLNAIIGAGNMTMQDLNGALGTGILPAAKTFGLKMKDVGAALAVFTDEGQSADSAATRLRMTFSLLGAPSQAAEKVLNGIGLSGHQLAEEMRKPNGLVNTIGLLKTHLEGLNNYYPNPSAAQKFVDLYGAKAKALLGKKHLTSAQQSLVDQYGQAKDNHLVLSKGGLDPAEQAAVLSRAFGGGKSGATVMSLVNNFDVLQKKEIQVSKGMRKFGADVAAQAKTPQAQFKTLISTLETLGVELGNKLLPLAVKGAKDLNGFVQWFDKLNPSVKSAAGGFALFLGALGPALLIGGAFAKSIIAINSALTLFKESTLLLRAELAALWVVEKVGAAVTKAVAVAQWALNVAMDANPVGLVVAALAALAVGLVIAYKKSATFRAIVQGAFHGVADAAKVAFNWVKDHWKLLAAILGGPIIAAVIVITSNWGRIKAGAADVVHAIKGFFSGLGSTLAAPFRAAVGIIGPIWDKLQGLALAYVRFQASIPGKILAAIGDLSHLLWNAGVQVIQGLINGVDSMVGSLVSKLHSITKLIPIHKGPIEKDRALLKPAGVAIMKGLLDGITKGWVPVKTALQKVTSYIGNEGSKLQSLLSAKASFVQGFQSFTSSVFSQDFTQTTTDANGNTVSTPGTIQQILGYQSGEAAKARRLARDVARLRKLGLSNDLIRQLQAGGATGEAQIHTLAMGSKADIAALNASNAATERYLRRAGESAASPLYNKQIVQTRNNIDLAKRIAHELKQMDHAGKREYVVVRVGANEIIRAVREDQRKRKVPSSGRVK